MQFKKIQVSICNKILTCCVNPENLYQGNWRLGSQSWRYQWSEIEKISKTFCDRGCHQDLKLF